MIINYQLDDIDILNLKKEQTIQEEALINLVPTKFDNYIGQEEIKKKLQIYIKAAKMRNEPLDHILLFGPPGLGKTTLAKIIAHEMISDIKICSAPMIERTGDMVSILTELKPNNLLFIDEIHRLPAIVEEVLYNAMEQFSIDIIIGKGTGSKSITIPINQFTLIGATTTIGKISAPLRSRFGIIERLEWYSDIELSKIIIDFTNYLNLNITEPAAIMLAKCSRATPRIAKKLLKRVRDFVQIQEKQIIDINDILLTINSLNIDQEGLTRIDNMILVTLYKNFNGGPVGLETLSAMIGEDEQTIEEVYEPFLLRIGYLEKTSRGRKIPDLIMRKLEIKLNT